MDFIEVNSCIIISYFIISYLLSTFPF